MKATRPNEIVYLDCIPVRTADKGMMYIFFAQDGFSAYVHQLGIKTDNSALTFLDMVYSLMQNPKFMNREPLDFILVARKLDEQLVPEVEKIIALENGQLIMDNYKIDKNTKDFRKHILKSFGI